MTYAVGIDFGGTKIIAGVVELSTGKLVGSAKKKTRQAGETLDITKRLALVVEEAITASGINRKQLTGIGIGAAGMVDRANGVLLNAVNLGLTELPLTAPLEQDFGVPAKLGNDVEVATLGEMHFGAGKGCDHFVCVFVGTGIGSGIVVNGQLLRGASGTAGEVGHTVLYPLGRTCGCGANGCLEAYASRTAVAKFVASEVARGQASQVADKIDHTKGILRSKVLSQAMEAGDPLVIRAITDAARHLGVGLATIVNFFNPQRIILGGGLVEASQSYYEIAAQEAIARSLPIAIKNTEIVKSGLGDFAGIIGAAKLTAL